MPRGFMTGDGMLVENSPVKARNINIGGSQVVERQQTSNALGTIRVSAAVNEAAQDIVIPGFGTPKAVIFVYNTQSSTGFGSFADSAGGIGFSDGTNDRSHASLSRGNLAAAVTDRVGSTTRCITRMFGAGLNTNEASTNLLIPDGIRLDWDVQSGFAFLITVIFIKGENVNAAVGTIDQDQTITGLSFRPDTAFFSSVNDTTAKKTSSALYALGVASDSTGSMQQAQLSFSDLDNADPTDINTLVRTDSIGSQILSGAEDWRSDVNAFTSDGIDLDATVAGSDLHHYLALNMGGRQVSIQSIDSATTTGDEAYTGFGFKPEALMLFTSDHDTLDIVETDGTGSHISVAVADGINEYAMGGVSEDNNTTSNAADSASESLVFVYSHTETKVAEGTLTSFDSDGFTLNYTTAPGTAHKYIAIAFSEVRFPTYGVTRVAAATSVATQDITIPGFGTPEAAIFMWGDATSDGITANDTRMGIGFTDGTNDRSHAIRGEDNVGTTNTERIADPLQLLSRPVGAGTLDEASFNSWITDGIRIDWDDQTVDAFLITCIFIKNLNGVAIGSVDQDLLVSTLSFAPDTILFSNVGDSATARTGHSILSLGASSNTSGIIEDAHVAYTNEDSDPSATVLGSIRDDSIGAQLFAGAETWRSNVASYDPGGFNLDSTAAGSDILYYMALNMGGSRVKIFTLQTLTATGDQDVDVGFQPGLVMFFTSDHDTLNQLETDGTGATIGFSASNSASQYSTGVTSEDGADPTNEANFASQNSLTIYNDVQTKLVEANWTQWNTDGFRLNYTTVDATPRLVMGVAFEGTSFTPAASAVRRFLMLLGVGS